MSTLWVYGDYVKGQMRFRYGHVESTLWACSENVIGLWGERYGSAVSTLWVCGEYVMDLRRVHYEHVASNGMSKGRYGPISRTLWVYSGKVLGMSTLCKKVNLINCQILHLSHRYKFLRKVMVGRHK